MVSGGVKSPLRHNPCHKSETDPPSCSTLGEHAFCYLLHTAVPCHRVDSGRCVDWGAEVDVIWQRWVALRISDEALAHLVGPALSYADALKLKHNSATLNRGEELPETGQRKA